MNGVNRLPMNSIAISLAQLLSTYLPSTTILLIGHTLSDNPVTPLPGYNGPAILPYTPTPIPNEGDLDTTMSWLKMNGFVFNYGISFPVTLSAPTSVSVSGTTTTLTWATRPQAFDQIQATYSGTVSQETTNATGTFAGFGPTGYSIVVTNTSGGVFDTTSANDITVTLNNPNSSAIDARTSDEIACMVYSALSASVGNAATSNSAPYSPNIYIAYMPASETVFGDGTLFQNVLSQSTYFINLVSPYEILLQTDFTKYSAFFTTVQALNAPTQVEFQKYGTFGSWAVQSVTPNNQTALLMNNSQYSVGYDFPYDNTVEPVYQYPGQVAAAAVVYNMTNPAPFIPQGKVVINGITPPSVNNGLSYSQAATALNLGYTPIYINNNGQPAFVRTITGLTTYPNTTAPATQYFDIQDWQKIFYNKGVKGARLDSEFQNQLYTPDYAKRLRSAMIEIDLGFEKASMLNNVPTWISQYTVSQDSSGKVQVVTPVEVTPGAYSVNITMALQNQFPVNTF